MTHDQHSDQYHVVTVLNVTDFHHYTRVKKDCDQAKLDVFLPMVDDMLCISYVAPCDKDKFLSILRHNGVKFEDYKMTVPVVDVNRVMAKAMMRKTFKPDSYVKTSGYGNLPLKVISHNGDTVLLKVELFNFSQEIEVHANHVSEHDRADEFTMSYNPPKEYSSVMIVDVPHIVSTLGDMTMDNVILFLLRIKTNMTKCKVVLVSPNENFIKVAIFLGLSIANSRFVKSKYCISDNTDLILLSENHVKVSERGEISITKVTEAHKYIIYTKEYTNNRVNEEHIIRMYDNIESNSKSKFLEHMEQVGRIADHGHIENNKFYIDKLYSWVENYGYGWFIENLSLYVRIIRG